MPSHESILENKHLGIFGTLLHDPNLWHFSRHSVTNAFAVGLFLAWVPVPMQMVLAVAIAILTPWRINLPVAIGLVWITNPVTMPFLYWFSYELGMFILGLPAPTGEFEASLEWFMSMASNGLYPFLFGCFVCGVVSAFVGYHIINILWTRQIKHHWRTRRGEA